MISYHILYFASPSEFVWRQRNKKNSQTYMNIDKKVKETVQILKKMSCFLSKIQCTRVYICVQGNLILKHTSVRKLT